MPQQQQQPRRILEKSRTVRRRYQRSNKRFEFSASQIKRIEREEEREKKAKQLREREKKKLANKKKRAEKEAKEREERRRLGIPEPNACKIPASQPLLLNFFGAGRKKVNEVKEQIEEKTEDSVLTQESEVSEDERKQESLSSLQGEEPDLMQEKEASDEDELIEGGEDGRKQDSLSPVQEKEAEMMPQQQPQQPSKTGNTTNCILEDFSDLETEFGDDFPVQEEEPDVMRQQEPQKPSMTDDTANFIPEDFSDLETELGDDWLDDPELEKHLVSIENTQQSLNSSAATHKDDQQTEPAQSATNNWVGMTESFEDDTSLMLQALDPTVLEEFETRPKAVLREVNKTAAPSPSVSAYAASNVRNGNPQYDIHRVNNLTPTNFRNAPPAISLYTTARPPPHEIKPQNQQIAQKPQLRTTATSSSIKTSAVHNTPPAFKKPVVAASMQPRKLHFSPKKSVGQSTRIFPNQKVYPQPHFEAEDEFGDLPLSTQDVRDLDSMVGLG